MQSKLLNDSNGQRTFAVILETGDEVQTCMKRFIEAEGIRAAQLTAIGAFSDVELLYFDWKAKKYHKSAISEQVEVASLIGDVAESPSGEPALHIHVVIGRLDSTALAGHLGQAHGSSAHGEPGTSAQKVRRRVRSCAHPHGELNDSIGAEAFGIRSATHTFRFRSNEPIRGDSNADMRNLRQ